MKREMKTPSSAIGSVANSSDTHKLVSLLALATGAVALPQTGHADIIFTDLSSEPVLVGFAGLGTNEFLFTLPGTAQVGFERLSGGPFLTQPVSVQSFYTVRVVAGDRGGGAGGIRRDGGFFAVPQVLGDAWSQEGVGTALNVTVGLATDLFAGRSPASDYSDRYLAWSFADSTQGGATRYGWVHINLDIVGFNAGGPTVTILGYAYDNTGAKPSMGMVPEPSSGALLVMGALALGSRGLRKWRQNRTAISNA